MTSLQHGMIGLQHGMISLQHGTIGTQLPASFYFVKRNEADPSQRPPRAHFAKKYSPVNGNHEFVL